MEGSRKFSPTKFSSCKFSEAPKYTLITSQYFHSLAHSVWNCCVSADVCESVCLSVFAVQSETKAEKLEAKVDKFATSITSADAA